MNSREFHVRWLPAGLAVFALITAACNTYRPPPPREHAYEPVFTVEYGQEKVWIAVIDAASELFFGIDTYERDSGLITLSFSAQKPSEFLECGRFADAPMSDHPVWGGLTGRINVFVKPAQADKRATEIRIWARYTLKHGALESNTELRWGGGGLCYPNNSLEYTFADRIRAALAEASAAD